SRAFPALTLAPKNCICLPTCIGETQQAIAASSPQRSRICSSDSYWIEEVSIEIAGQTSFYPAGSCGSQKMVMFGSGAGPRFRRVCSRRNEVLVTWARPSAEKPASDQVAQYGSPEKIWS